MCGISGFLLRDDEKAQERDLEKMAEAMQRRGPDAQGVFAVENAGLAHRRLKILDLTPAGAQPMFNEDGRVGVVYNGEIYNFPQLKTSLESKGHVFRSRSDTEVILHAFEEWGTESFQKFNGIFAFALLDRRGGRPVVYLARDRFGAKPLFYSWKNKRLAFASELKPLFTLSWLGRELDRRSLLGFLKFSHVPTPRSMIQGIEQVEPGTWLRFEKSDCQRGRFFSPTELVSPPPAMLAGKAEPSEREWCQELDTVLRDCVTRQLVADVPVGCFLSGGVDSSLLTLAYSEAENVSTVKTFSIGYKEKEFDETPYARQIAALCGTEHHEVIVGPQDYMDLIPELPDYFDQPFADPSLLSSLLLSKFARQHVTVALSGDGGDELFFGYSQQKALRWLGEVTHIPSGMRQAFFQGLERASMSVVRMGLGGKSLQQLRKLSEILQFTGEEELFNYFIGMIGPLRMDRVEGLLNLPLAGFDDKKSAGVGCGDSSSREQRIALAFIERFLVDTVLAKTDRATMAYGLEARVPFLDDAMAGFSTRLPFHYKLNRGRTKYLLRRLFEAKIEARLKNHPDANGSLKGMSARKLSFRPKQGFSIPLRDWLRGDLKYLLDEYLNEARLRREDLFQPKKVKGLVVEHLKGQANHSHLLWSLVSFQMWKERYLP